MDKNIKEKNSSSSSIEETFRRILKDKTLSQYLNYLHDLFLKTSSYDEFIKAINHELHQRFGVQDWAYAFLDLPDRLAVLENFGTVKGSFMDEYMDCELYNHDLILQYVRATKSQVFQSDLVHTVNNSKMEGYTIARYKQLYQLNKKNGFDEVFCIPISSSLNGEHCLFTVTSRYLECSKHFKRRMAGERYYLSAIAIAINDIGIRRYKNQFLVAQANYKSIAYSQPLNLLATMVKYDLDVKEGAERLGIAYNTAAKHIKKIKSMLGASTIHGAYDKAIKEQLII